MALDWQEFARIHDVKSGGEVPMPDVEMPDEIKQLDIPEEFIDLDMMENYMDDELYWLDVKIREMIHSTSWKARVKDKPMRVSVPSVFAVIFGREMISGTDAGLARKMHRILGWYAKKTTGPTWITQPDKSKKQVRHAYYFTRYAGQTKRPYSTRLALEEANGDVNVLKHTGARRTKTLGNWASGLSNYRTSDL